MPLRCLPSPGTPVTFTRPLTFPRQRFSHRLSPAHSLTFNFQLAAAASESLKEIINFYILFSIFMWPRGGRGGRILNASFSPSAKYHKEINICQPLTPPLPLSLRPLSYYLREIHKRIINYNLPPLPRRHRKLLVQHLSWLNYLKSQLRCISEYFFGD